MLEYFTKFFAKFFQRIPKGATANAIRWQDRILIHAEAKTVPGFYMACFPWLKLPRDASQAELGAAIQEALRGFRSDVPVPDFRTPSGKAFLSERLQAAGVRSERQFMNGSERVDIDTRNGVLRFTPCRNNGAVGPKRGYSEINEAAAEMPFTATADELGKCLNDAWARCA